jgi:hypothetical protein
MEVRQRMKFTGTNSSIGLIVLILHAHRVMRWRHEDSFSNNVRFADLVVMAERLHPIPFRTRP